MKNEVRDTTNLDLKIQNPATGLQNPLSETTPKASLRSDSEAGKKMNSSVKTINLSGDRLIITDEIPGVYVQGIQYYDLKNIGYISYTGMANLIDFIKTILEKGIEVKFVNVNEKIKNKIKSIGLEHILHCV